MAPLAYDTIVTVITVGKAIMIRRRRGGPSSMLIQTFIREGDYVADTPPGGYANQVSGVFYYILISIANLASHQSFLGCSSN